MISNEKEALKAPLPFIYKIDFLYRGIPKLQNPGVSVSSRAMSITRCSNSAFIFRES